MTQEQLCTRARISNDAVTRIEGGTRVPNLATLEHLAQAFGVGLAAFFDGAAPPAERSVPAAVRKVTTLLETQPNDVLVLAENAVAAVVRAYSAGSAAKAAAPAAPKHPQPGFPRAEAAHAGASSRKRRQRK